jgi:hypothetical protein
LNRVNLPSLAQTEPPSQHIQRARYDLRWTLDRRQDCCVQSCQRLRILVSREIKEPGRYAQRANPIAGGPRRTDSVGLGIHVINMLQKCEVDAHLTVSSEKFELARRNFKH